MANSNEPGGCLAVKLSPRLLILKTISDVPMLKTVSTICLLACLLSACVTKPYQDSSLAIDLEKVNKRIAELESGLPEKLAESCTAIALEVSESEAKAREAEVEKRIAKAHRACVVTKQVPPPPKKKEVAKLNGKLFTNE